MDFLEPSSSSGKSRSILSNTRIEGHLNTPNIQWKRSPNAEWREFEESIDFRKQEGEFSKEFHNHSNDWLKINRRQSVMPEECVNMIYNKIHNKTDIHKLAQYLKESARKESKTGELHKDHHLGKRHFKVESKYEETGAGLLKPET